MTTLKFIIEVPDKIIKIEGTSGKTIMTLIDTTEESIYQALTMNEYHDNIFFDPETQAAVKVKLIKQ